MRPVRQRVLPAPGPASTSTGPTGAVTAHHCCGKNVRPITVCRLSMGSSSALVAYLYHPPLHHPADYIIGGCRLSVGSCQLSETTGQLISGGAGCVGFPVFPNN